MLLIKQHMINCKVNPDLGREMWKSLFYDQKTIEIKRCTLLYKKKVEMMIVSWLKQGFYLKVALDF